MPAAAREGRLRLAASTRRVTGVDRLIARTESGGAIRTIGESAGIAMKFVGARISHVGSLLGKSLFVMPAAGIADATGAISVFNRLVGGHELHRAIRTCIVPARGLVKNVRPRVSTKRFCRDDDTRKGDRR
jgi:hypothetical protein